MIRTLFAVSLILRSIGSAVATPWQISYEGDAFPENQGWFLEGASNDPDPDRAAYQRAVADTLEQLWSL
jgi:hypothetical protein